MSFELVLLLALSVIALACWYPLTFLLAKIDAKVFTKKLLWALVSFNIAIALAIAYVQFALLNSVAIVLTHGRGLGFDMLIVFSCCALGAIFAAIAAAIQFGKSSREG